MLKTLNPHPNDSKIFFDEEPHVYYVDKTKIETSVTSFVHKYFPSFDASRIAINVHKKHFKNSESNYFGMSIDEIKESWEVNRIKASTAGTELHKSIEKYYNNQTNEINEELKKRVEWTYFLNFLEDNPDLKPYRTEWEIFDISLNLAGSIDMVFRNSVTGKYTIYDWKRSKEIKMTNVFEDGFFPIEHLPNSNYWHYTLQLNIYKRILETKYDLQIDGMHLIVLHENNKNYKHYEVSSLDSEVDTIFSDRLETLKSVEKIT